MSKAILDIDLLPILEPITAILDRVDAVQQQQVIELLIVRHAWKFGEGGHLVIDGVIKHIRQLYSQGVSYR